MVMPAWKAVTSASSMPLLWPIRKIRKLLFFLNCHISCGGGIKNNASLPNGIILKLGDRLLPRNYSPYDIPENKN